ncbi:hypothetical protein [Streptomyces sp. NPDC087300]|uniref:hypothetical protein n=1 Tax=Streptomyces sp. NPDC087300 TaxID=3365780 RepID=UPI003803FE16
MQGDGAWNTNRHTVPGTGVHLSWENGAQLPVDELAPAHTREPTVVHTHVTVGGQEPFDALPLYLVGALPGFCRLSVDPDGDNGVLNPPPKHWPGAAIVRGASLARLATDRIGDGHGVYEFVVQGYGPHSHLAAQEMVGQVRHWQRNHRAALCPRITVRPLAGGDPTSTATADIRHVFVKEHTRVAIGWPVTPSTAAVLTDDHGRYLLHLRSANNPIRRPGQWALLGGNTENQGGNGRRHAGGRAPTGLPVQRGAPTQGHHLYDGWCPARPLRGGLQLDLDQGPRPTPWGSRLERIHRQAELLRDRR